MSRSTKLAAAVALTFAASAAHAQHNFAAATFLDAGKAPMVLTRGDFNADGRIDLAVGNSQSNDVTVYLAKSGGGYESKSYMLDSFPGRINVVDVNGDSRPDLVVLNQLSQSIAVLTNDGTGHFERTQTLRTERSPDRLLTWRSDGGYTRIVVSNGGDNSISYYAFDQSGKEIGHKTITVGRTPNAMLNVDLDQDGVAEIVVANSGDGMVAVVARESDAVGAPKELVNSYFAGLGATSISSPADLDGDGRPDIVVAAAATDGVSVLLNDGNKQFKMPVHYKTDRGPSSVAVGDLDGDGDQDLVVANGGVNSVSVLLNNGDGSFAKADSYTTGNTPTFPVITDADGDGKLDVVVANTQGTISVLGGMGDGRFTTMATIELGTATTGYTPITARGSAQVADFDQDGNPDIAVALPTANKIAMIANPNGSFVRVVEYERTLPSGSKHFFVTPLANEKSELDAGKFEGWKATGQAFRAYKDARAGGVPVCRFFSSSLDSHFYSATPGECEAVAAMYPDVWGAPESTSLFHAVAPAHGVCATGRTAIYRLFNNRADVNHRLTTSKAERDAMVDAGWVSEGFGSEGIVMCAP